MGERLKRAKAAAKATREPWRMPSWMEQYRDRIQNTGGNSVEDLVNDHTTTAFENAPRAILCVAVKSQVTLLELLHRDGVLAALGVSQ